MYPVHFTGFKPTQNVDLFILMRLKFWNISLSSYKTPLPIKARGLTQLKQIKDLHLIEDLWGMQKHAWNIHSCMARKAHFNKAIQCIVLYTNEECYVKGVPTVNRKRRHEFMHELWHCTVKYLHIPSWNSVYMWVHYFPNCVVVLFAMPIFWAKDAVRCGIFCADGW